MKILGKTVTLILLTVFFVGFLVLLYPAISQYWNSKVQSRAIADYEKMLANMSTADYSAFFENAYDYNRRLAALDAPLRQHDEVDGYYDTLNFGDNGIMGYVSIGKIQVELPIYHGTSTEVLNIACGHIEGTSLPVGGEGTHSVLSAHRGLPTASLFTHLDKLEPGDIFTITILDKVLTYQVDDITIIEPQHTEPLAIVPGKDYCTLLTCTPYGINTHRLLVRGARIETKEAKKVYVNAEAYIVDRLIVAPSVALPILFVFIMIVLFKPAKKKVILDENGKPVTKQPGQSQPPQTKHKQPPSQAKRKQRKKR